MNKRRSSSVVVKPITSDHLGEFVALLRAIEAETHPDDPAAPGRAEAGLLQSVAQYDFTQSDACWLLLAWVRAQVAGYALAVRLPKADARKGFLFVDELYVLKPWRRRGVAMHLLKQVHDLARREGYAGVRLLVRPSNHTARKLYTRLGYAEYPSILCESLMGHV